MSVLRHKGQLFALDSVCYHAGGPLAVGEIEVVAGRDCVLCPWHHYPVALDNGEKLYQSTVKDASGKLQPGPWQAVGPRQRTHDAEQRADGVYVRLRLDGAVESDAYAHNAACGARLAHPLTQPAQRSGAAFQSSRGADGKRSNY